MELESVKLLFRRNEFEELATNREDITVYYKRTWDAIYLLILCDFSGRDMPDAVSLSHILWRICTDGRFAAGNQQALALLFVKDTAYGRAVLQDRIPAWIVEKNTWRLMIYENQPSDFAGIRTQLEKALEEEKLKQRRKPSSQFTLCNSVLIAVNALVFFAMNLTGAAENKMIEWGAMYTPIMDQPREFYRIFTAMFLHFDLGHLTSNMIILIALGDNLERALGRWRYLLVYFLSGIGAGIFSCVYYMVLGNAVVAAGASGAIFGVIGGLFCLTLKNKGRLEELTAPRLALMIAYILYSGFTTPNVDNMAHIGGLLTGLAATFLLSARRRAEE